MASGAKSDDSGGRGLLATVFVCDPTAEAERIAQAIRSASYVVVDVPLSMLVARVAVQRPRVVLIDADNEGALDVVTRVRELPEADDIHVLFLARPGGAITSPNEALAHEGSDLFVRPVDVAELVRKVNALTSTRADAEVARANAAPSPLSSPSLGMPESSRPSLAAASPSGAALAAAASGQHAIAPVEQAAQQDVMAPGFPLAPGSGRGIVPSRQVVAFGHALSPELQQLLADAEERVAVRNEPEPPVPSPEDEIEAVMPSEWLAALDEPLDEDEDDDPALGRSILPVPRDRTGVGGAQRTRTASTAQEITTGSTSARAPASSPLPVPDGPLTPPPGQTLGGTHSGSTSGGGSATSARATGDRDEARAHHAEDSLPQADERRFPSVLGPGDAMRVVARAVAWRTTATLCLVSSDAERRLVLREGDLMTASSSLDDESLLAFLVARGDLPKETLRRAGPKVPSFGRHAAASLVARGCLRQDQMWAVLRAHAEWLLARVLPISRARLAVEAHPPGRLASEPAVFGASAGAEVFVEVVRRIVAPAEAIERMGGYESHVVDGSAARLLGECALAPTELELVRSVGGRTLAELLDSAPDGDLATVLFALWQLGVVDVVRSVGERGTADAGRSAEQRRAVEVSALDTDALRERVRARMQLVEDGDYFALLGVPRDATGYEVRRAFLELRRALDPSRVLTPEVSDLADDVRKIVLVLEEAYDILKDAARRERYRLAIES